MLRSLLPSASRLFLKPQIALPTSKFVFSLIVLYKNVLASRSYAAPVGGKVVPAKEDKSFVEEDAEKISKYVCVNYFVEGETFYVSPIKYEL